MAQLSFLPAVQTQEFRMAEGVYDHKGSSIDGGTAIDLERLVPANSGRSQYGFASAKAVIRLVR